MKKLLSILGIIGLTTTSTTSLISCEKPNNNENEENNKPKPAPEPQQPPKNSNWELIDYPTSTIKLRDLFKNPDNKWYVINLFTTQEGYIIRKFKFTNKTKLVKKSDYDETAWKYKFKDYEGLPTELVGYYRYVYRWNGVNEPQTPEINNGGEITDWKK
ncbi:hypothetical protein D9R21_03240 [Spiroplasma endosymbiont of Megaselia nigra]|nr:hypothetical protein D9R21_03240 [Spiroplasma endosymbiont of Megaselia nigra]